MNFDVAILCGGGSRRMGRDKAGVLLDGVTLLERKIMQMQGFSHILLCVGVSASTAQISGCELVFDQFPDHGPMAGIHAALCACTSKLLFVSACDMPFAGRSVALALLPYLKADIDVVVPVLADGRMLFVCALFRKHCVAALEELLRSGRCRLREISKVLSVKTVSAEELPVPQAAWINVNTPEDLIAAETVVRSFCASQ